MSEVMAVTENNRLPKVCMQAYYEVKAVECEKKGDLQGWSKCLDSVTDEDVGNSVADFKEECAHTLSLHAWHLDCFG